MELEYVFNMIKRSYYILVLIIFSACNSDTLNGCFQASGPIVETAFSLSDFTKIQIEGEVSLFVKQGPFQEVVVETGENLLSDVYVAVEGETLIIRDGNTCNVVRDYGITKAYVTAPNINELRNSSTYDIRSDGVLNFPELRLVSNTEGGIENVRKGGDFYLDIVCESFKVSANGQSVFYVSGTATKADIIFSDEAPRFEGAGLEIGELELVQRSANKMIVNPQHKIEGVIYGTGDVISLNEPPIVDVQQIFTGQLIFQD